MPVHPPYSDPAIATVRSRASNDFKTVASNHATGDKLEMVELAKFFGSLMAIYMLTGLGILLFAKLTA